MKQRTAILLTAILLLLAIYLNCKHLKDYDGQHSTDPNDPYEEIKQ